VSQRETECGVIRALLASAAVYLFLTSATAASAAVCRDTAFQKAAVTAVAQRTKAIGEAYLENYASAKADAFTGWRTMMNGPVPCSLRLREARTHLLRNLGALWLSYTAMAAGDITDGLAFLVVAAKEARQVPADLGHELERHSLGGERAYLGPALRPAMRAPDRREPR
jgi:hypothetical protein